MPDNSIQIRVNADLSDVKGQFQGLQTQVAAGSQGMAGATEPFNRALLNQHQSIHLLAEEMGIHLPRAVVGGISEMLPPINMIGPALMGAFAVDMLVKFGESMVKTSEEINGVAAAEKALAEAGKQNASQMEEMAKASEKYARSQLPLLRIQLANTQADIDNANVWIRRGEMMGGWFYDQILKVTGAEAKLQADRDSLTQTTKLYDDVVNIMGKDEDKAHKKAAEAARRHAQVELEAMKRLATFNTEVVQEKFRAERQWDRMVKEDAHTQAEALKLETASMKEFLGMGSTNFASLLANGFRQLSAAEREQIPLSISTTNQMAMMTQRMAEQHQEAENRTLPGMKRINLEYQHTMDIARREAEVVHQAYLKKKAVLADYEAAVVQLRQVEQGATKAKEDGIKVLHQEQIAQVGLLSSGIAGLIGGRRAQAGVEAAFEVAEGVKLLAEGTWPPNPAAILASAMHFEAAAEYAKVAGNGGGGSRGGGGGGGGTQSSYGRGGGGGGRGGDSGSGSGGGGAATPGSGTTVHMNIQGLISPDNLAQVMTQMTQLAKGGQATLIATGSMTTQGRMT